MTFHLGSVDASSTLYIPFHTFNSAGASVTISGLAVTDIEIYKNGSTTQRSSDNGYTLLDTDGIDFDSLTGIHGFSVDLSDNTDAGFFAAGSFYWVVVSAITADSQTVSFVAATFRIGPAAANVTQFGGSAGTFSGGRPEVNTTHAAGTAWGSGAITAAAIAAAALNGKGDWNIGKTGYALSSAGVQAIWDALTSALTTVGSIGKLLVDNINASISSRLASASYTAPPTATENADALLNRDMSAVSDTNARSPLNALRFLRNKWAVSGTTLTVRKEDDSTSAWTSTISTDAAADPITGSDPA